MTERQLLAKLRAESPSPRPQRVDYLALITVFEIQTTMAKSVAVQNIQYVYMILV